MSGNSNGMSTGMAIICTLGILLLIGWIGTISIASSGGKSTTTSGSKSTYSSSNTTSGSKKTYSSGSSTAKKRNSSMDSYDEGYNAIYEDDDFDWDRYESDDDYAAGVDDAMEDEEDGDW